MCITQAGVWVSYNLQFLFFCLKHEVSVMKKKIILENVNGYIHVVDVTILARNVWQGM